MSLKVFVSRTFAIQSCIIVAVAYGFALNAIYGRFMMGWDVASTVLVGSIIGALIAAVIGLVDFMTYFAGRKKDFAMCNLTGVVGAITVYNFNVIMHMNTAGFTMRGIVMSIVLGLACGNAYASACGAVKKLSA
ncbi:hypothetical protein BH10CYA1_BH10CYA1_32230 [soil metagenome]